MNADAKAPHDDGAGHAPPAQLLQRARAAWAGLTPRDRRLLLLAAGILLAYLAWALALQPALRTLRSAPAQIDRLDAQLQVMQALAADARDLRALPPVPRAQAAAALKAASERLGAQGRLAEQGDRAVLTLSNASGEQLRAWLAEVRSAARVRPVDVKLTRSDQGLSGTVVVTLPGA